MLSRIRVFGLLTALVCALQFSSRAQTPTPTPLPVQMALASPFARTPKPLMVMAQAGKWVPIAITLSNTGDPVSGQVQLQLSPVQGASFDYSPNVITADVDLPTNSHKQVWLYARLDRPDVGGVDVSFSGRGFRELSQRVPITQPDPLQREIMVVSDTDIGLDDTFRALRTQALFRGGRAPSNNFGTGVAPVVPFSFGKELVPDRWIGFQSADMVVLGDFPHIQLSPTQIDALRGYVEGGGTLVVMGGANAGRLSSSPLKDLWPLVPTSSVPATSKEVSDIVSEYVPNPQGGADRLGGAPVVVTRGQLTPDAIAHDGSQAQPLSAEKNVGAGRVLYLSYDPSQPPFKGWSGQGQLWSDLIKQAAKVNEIDTVDNDFMSSSVVNFGNGGYAPPPSYTDEGSSNSLTDQLLGTLSHAQQLTMPPVSRIAWFLALYVFFLVPVNYAVLRIIDRRELAWVTIPVIVVAFSVWAYTEALSIRGRTILTRQMDVVQSSFGSTEGRVDTLFWLFSPRRTTYNITTQGQSAALCDYATKAGGEQGSFTLSQPPDGSSFKIDGAPLRMWTDRAFASQSLGDLKRGISLSGNSLRNGTGIDLYGVVWVQDGHVVGVGEIKNGSSVTLTQGKGDKFTADIVGEIMRASKLDAVFDASSRDNGIPKAALTTALGEGFGKWNKTPMLIAWGKQSVAPFSIGLDSGQTRQMTLFVIRASKLSTQLAAHEAVVHPVSFEPFTSNQKPSQGGFQYFDCYVPASKSLFVVARGTGASRFSVANSSDARLSTAALKTMNLSNLAQLEAWNIQTSHWEGVSGAMTFDPSPVGGWNFKASISPDSVSRFVRSPDNKLRLRVRLDNTGVQVSSLNVEA